HHNPNGVATGNERTAMSKSLSAPYIALVLSTKDHRLLRDQKAAESGMDPRPKNSSAIYLRWRAQPRWGWALGRPSFPQGSSFLATLGFEAESRWDSRSPVLALRLQ